MASSDLTPRTANRSTAQIEADLAATRNRLASSVESLIDQVHPARIKQRTVGRAKQVVRTEIDNAKSQVLDENGLRKDRIAILAGALAGFVTFVLIIKRISRRGRKD